MAKGHRSQIKREEMLRRIQDRQQSYPTLESLFRKHASYWMLFVAKMFRQHLVL